MAIDLAIVPVAGQGTRLLPLTKSQPKEMLPVGRKPIVVVGILGFAVSFLIMGLADSFAVLMTGRVLGGLLDDRDGFRHQVDDHDLVAIDDPQSMQGGAGLQRVRLHPGAAQAVHDPRRVVLEPGPAVQEEVEVARRAVMQVESDERRAAGQGPGRPDVREGLEGASLERRQLAPGAASHGA